MELITRLPNDINIQIMDYLWGSRRDHQKYFSQVLDTLPVNILINLRATESCKYKNKIWDDIEDNLYCPCCGEKSLDFTYACNGWLCDFCSDW